MAAFAFKTIKKTIFGHGHTFVFVLAYAVFTMLFFTSGISVQNKPAPVQLYPQLLLTVPQFYIVKVEDKRTEQKAVAWIYLPSGLKPKLVLQAVDLKSGGLHGIQDFMWQSFPQNKKLRPVLIHLKECKVTESVTASGRIEGKVALLVSFDLYKADEPVKLTDYRIDSKYIRTANQQNMPGMMISNSLTAALKYFDTWINRQADHHPKLATGVQVAFKDYHEETEGDTIYYALNRPLQWSDFQEKPRGTKFAAMVFPSFGFEEKKEISNGIIKIRLEMKVYVPKSACWVKDDYRNDYTLNHEQRHFDLVKIVAKHFEQQISAATLPVTNYDGVINVQFYESFREMNHLQEQYDDETQHGLSTAQQGRWNKRIDQELTLLSVKKADL